MRAETAWIEVEKSSPYFRTDEGVSWTPIGQNDGITWPELRGLYRRRDVVTAESYLKRLAAHGVTCLRLMLEYSQGARHHFERPAGHPRPEMIQLWDDLFALCERHGLRILLTPFDTFWMWIRWAKHPYNQANGGPCANRASLLLCPESRAAIKARLAFAAERWGGSGALFAWDLWNEIHPSYAGNSAATFADLVEDLSVFLRRKEMDLYGRSHPQTVSVFGPHMTLDSRIPATIFRHPCLDFANTHIYEEGTIDFPSNTVDAALSMGRLAREAIAELRDARPFFDSEHGPIHTFKDRRKTLPAPFDDEYFRHMQWAHLCAGGAGGGMRWPNRKPHSLTSGMRRAQRGLAAFLPLLDWGRFERKNWNDEVRVSNPAVKAVACGDSRQALAWLVRTDSMGRDGRLRLNAGAAPCSIELPRLEPGCYRVTAWDTRKGSTAGEFTIHSGPAPGLRLSLENLKTDLALAVRRV